MKAFLDFNYNPKHKLLISGSIIKIYYPERHILHIKSKTNENLITLIRNSNEVISNDKEFLYNKQLHSYFACFSSSVYYANMNTHCFMLKTFEILSSGSLLVMPLKEEKYILEIGLVNMNNCYLIDFNKELDPQIDYIFNNINLFNTIRKQGQEHAITYLNEKKMIDTIKQIIEL